MVSDESGQMVPVVAGVVMACGLAIWVLSWLGAAAVERARGQTAADASALAGAAGGDAAAHTLAEINGHVVLEVVREGSEIEVTVMAGGGRVSARARIEQSSGPGGPDHRGLAPAMMAALARAEQLLGRQVPIASGFRDNETQQRLWDNRHVNPYPVARPGSSRHERGLAVDIPRSFVPVLLPVALDAGLCRPLPRSDPVHFELCPTR